MSLSPDNVPVLFLQNLGISSFGNRDDGKKIARFIVGLYDCLALHKAAIKNIQLGIKSLPRATTTHGRAQAIDLNSSVTAEVLHNVSEENSMIREELKDLKEENLSLKRLLLGVNDAHLPLKKYLNQFYGHDFSECQTVDSIVEKLVSLRPPSPVDKPPLSNGSLSDIAKTQKEESKSDVKEKIGGLQSASNSRDQKDMLESVCIIAGNDLQLTQQLQTLNESMYDSFKKLVSLKNSDLSVPRPSEHFNQDYVRRLITTTENLKAVNQEILKNESLSRLELESTMTALKTTRSELDKTLTSYDQLKSYRAKLEGSLSSLNEELDKTKLENSRLRDNIVDFERRSENFSQQISSLQSELDAAKGSCKALRREKDVLMATYCRVVKENEKFRDSESALVGDDVHRLESIIILPLTSLGLQGEVERWRSSSDEWERQAATYAARIEELEHSISTLDDLKNDYATQIQLLQRGSSDDTVRQLRSDIAKLESDKRDLQAALGEESRNRSELEEMCVKLDKARRALKDQIQFIRNENERVLESVKKQIRTEIFSSQQTPMLKINSQASPISSPDENLNDIQELIEQAKEDLRQAAEISSPGFRNPGHQGEIQWEI